MISDKDNYEYFTETTTSKRNAARKERGGIYDARFGLE